MRDAQSVYCFVIDDSSHRVFQLGRASQISGTRCPAICVVASFPLLSIFPHLGRIISQHQSIKMQSLALVLASSLALFAEAAPQAAPAAPSPAPAPSPPTMSTNATNQFVITTVSAATAARVVPVVVGGTALTFTPNSVMANPGDIIQFQFDASNHTVTQSGETTPCQPLQATQPNAIHSGFIPFDQASGMVGTFNMPVTSTDPMFLYCAQGPHVSS